MTLEQIQKLIRDNREKKQKTKKTKTKQAALRSLIRAAGSRELLDQFLHEHGLEVSLCE